MVKFTFEITEEAYNLLKRIGEDGGAEYRDIEYLTLEDFKDSEIFISGKRTEEWFLNRNFGGTYHLTEELIKYDLIDIHPDAWHTTYIITELGLKILERKEK